MSSAIQMKLENWDLKKIVIAYFSLFIYANISVCKENKNKHLYCLKSHELKALQKCTYAK